MSLTSIVMQPQPEQEEIGRTAGVTAGEVADRVAEEAGAAGAEGRDAAATAVVVTAEEDTKNLLATD